MCSCGLSCECHSGLERDPRANVLRLNTAQGQETSSFETEAQSEGSWVTAELKGSPKPHHKPIMTPDREVVMSIAVRESKGMLPSRGTRFDCLLWSQLQCVPQLVLQELG